MIKGRYIGGGQSRYGGPELMTCAPYKKAKCAQCGKRFMRTTDHVYKREDNGQKWYCSYKCFRVKAKEDEQKEKEKFERALHMLDRKEEKYREYLQRKKEGKSAGKDERVICRTLADAQKRLEDAEEKIRFYGHAYLAAEAGSYERTQARKNMTRWERKRKYLREEVEYFEEQEAEEE